MRNIFNCVKYLLWTANCARVFHYNLMMATHDCSAICACCTHSKPPTKAEIATRENNQIRTTFMRIAAYWLKKTYATARHLPTCTSDLAGQPMKCPYAFACEQAMFLECPHYDCTCRNIICGAMITMPGMLRTHKLRNYLAHPDFNGDFFVSAIYTITRAPSSPADALACAAVDKAEKRTVVGEVLAKFIQNTIPTSAAFASIDTFLDANYHATPLPVVL